MILTSVLFTGSLFIGFRIHSVQYLLSLLAICGGNCSHVKHVSIFCRPLICLVVCLFVCLFVSVFFPVLTCSFIIFLVSTYKFLSIASEKNTSQKIWLPKSREELCLYLVCSFPRPKRWNDKKPFTLISRSACDNFSLHACKALQYSIWARGFRRTRQLEQSAYSQSLSLLVKDLWHA